MMVRFSCFPTHIHYHKTKKAINQSLGETFSEEMQKSSLEFSQNVLKVSPGSPSSILKEEKFPSNTTTEKISSPASLEYCWKSEELNSNSYSDDNKVVLQTTCLKKSQSLGSGLDREREFSCGVDMEDDTDQGTYTFDKDHGRCCGCVHSYGLADLCDNDGSRKNLLSPNHESVGVESVNINSELLQHEPLFSIGDGKQIDKELHEGFSFQQSAEHFIDSGHIRSETPAGILKSQSLPCLRVSTAIPTEGSPAHEYMGYQSRTFEDLHVADAKTDILRGQSHSGGLLHQPSATSYCHHVSQTSGLHENSLICHVDSVEVYALSNVSGGTNKMVDQENYFITEGEKHKMVDQENYFITEGEEHNGDHQLSDGYDSRTFSVSANEWREREVDCLSTRNTNEKESLVQKWDEPTSKEFNIKRIEDWVRQIDIQDSFIVQELGESSISVPKVKQESNVMNGVTTVKPDDRGSPGIVEAYNYISSLTAASTTAQMENLGLVVIPFLSAFVTLRMLNLSGNAIVRINAGALPRGLHILNLSKNNISTIEGLRELTRLRILDLSYNRILRIGHGLASCSSLKELYLAGNKISEVEGLHRLLKLNILDLRLNKISTAKCLGQLAANYASLQSINLEGNPAQRNVGDEQLKKYLLSLLPHLVYYNRHTIRTSSSKEISDRPSRTIGTHQFDRGSRPEHKHARRGKFASAAHKSVTSSNRGRSSQTVGNSSNLSRSRPGHLPLAGPKGTHQLPDIGGSSRSLHSSNSMRSLSAGNF